jgi:Excalibur calcium-binding domain
VNLIRLARLAPFCLLTTVVLLATAARPASSAETPRQVGVRGAAVPVLFKNCTNVNRRYPHRVGKFGARDSTSGDPVRAFKHSTLLYNRAMSYNRGLDRDKDGIACEKQKATQRRYRDFSTTASSAAAHARASSAVSSILARRGLLPRISHSPDMNTGWVTRSIQLPSRTPTTWI